MTTNQPVQEVGETGQCRQGKLEGILNVARLPEGRARYIPVRWVVSQVREISVARKEDGY
jgi:hypothetical protein